MISVFRHDQETVGASHGGEIARSLPGNERDFRDRAGKAAGSGEKTGEAGFCFDVLCQVGEDESRARIESSGEGGDDRCGEEQESDGGGDRIAGKAEDEALRAVLALDLIRGTARHLAKALRAVLVLD